MAVNLVVLETNYENVIKKLYTLGDKTLPRYVKRGHNRTAEILVQKLRSNVPIWRGIIGAEGTLLGSIKKKVIDENTIGIYMIDYATDVEMGTLPRDIESWSPEWIKLRQWANDKLPQGMFYKLLEHIGLYGTKAHPFTEKSIEQSKIAIDKEMEDNSIKAIKEAGFR